MGLQAPEVSRPRRSPEEELAARVLQQAAVARLGVRALSGLSFDALTAETVRLVAATMQADYVALFEALDVDDEVLLRAGHGWPPATVGTKMPAAEGSWVRAILDSSQPVIIEDLGGDERYHVRIMREVYGVRSSMGVAIVDTDRPYGVLSAHSTRTAAAFSSDEVAFLQAIANLVGIARARTRSDEALLAALEREKDAVERLQSLNEMKNSFLEAVSHELRTPLASVLGFALTLQERKEGLSESEGAVMLERLVINAIKLDRLLRDLLDLDRLYRRTIRPARRPTDLAELIRVAVAGVEAGGHPVHVPAGTFDAFVDAPKVERIVENLVVNATRHTPGGSTIWVRLGRGPDGTVIAVEDDGPGVPDDLKGSIFDVFRRGGKSVPGTGVGLSLVRRFAEMHGGGAWVEDRPGGGARFCVLLPDASPAG
ncbi:MAG TPA: ATP-binding protein [Actinomycetota bacterium]|nr:ATP-binding protein [Actinomycetota bacterium]